MFDEDDGERGGGKATEWNAGIGDRVAKVLFTLGRELRNKRSGGGKQHPDAEAGHEAEEAEHDRRTRERGRRHTEREPGIGAEHHLPTTDDVADAPGNERADEDAEQGVATERAS